MPVYESQSSSAGPEIPENTILNASVVAVGEREKPWKNDDGTPQIKVDFMFVIDDPESEFNGRKIYGETPTTFTSSDRCKLRQWAQEILAEDNIGRTLDTDSLVGKTCRVVVNQRIKKADGTVYNFVGDVMRAKNATPSSYEQF